MKIKLPVLNMKVDYEGSILLESVPETFRARVLLARWLDFLIERVGGNVEDVLRYYVEVGWISEEVMKEILKHTRGISLGRTLAAKMEVKDHLVSLRFINMIKKAEKI